jgi:hypothetical protein
MRTTGAFAAAKPSPVKRPHVHVALVGSRAAVPDIAGLLPRRWDTARYYQLTGVSRADMIILGGASPAIVAAARLLHPAATIVAVIGPRSPESLFVSLIRVGADACVRAGTPVWLARQALGAHGLRHRPGAATASGAL